MPSLSQQPKEKKKTRRRRGFGAIPRYDRLLVTIGALLFASATLSLTSFAPLHQLSSFSTQVKKLPVLSALTALSASKVPCRGTICCHPRVLYSSTDAWGTDDPYLKLAINATTLHQKEAEQAQEGNMKLISTTLVGTSKAYSSRFTMPSSEDVPTYQVKLGRKLAGPLSQFDVEKCCRGYDSSYYRDVGKHCVPMAPEWQGTYRPTCNNVHEFDLADGTNGISLPEYIRNLNKEEAEEMKSDMLNSLSILYNNGDYRDVWVVGQSLDGYARVIKTLRYRYGVTPKYIQMFTDEANAFGHLTASPYVANAYGLCGVSSMMDFSASGGFKRIARKGWLTNLEKLKLATQVARSAADVHDFDREGRVTMAVADISSGQFVYNDDTHTYQIMDMNLVRMMKVEKESGRVCPFKSAPDAGSVRSPEEYWEHVHDEKVDIWAVGNVIHYILCGDYAFSTHDISESKIRLYVRSGKTPPSFAEVEERGDEIETDILRVIKKIRRRDPAKRPTAAAIQEYLEERLLHYTGSDDATIDPKAITETHSQH